MEEIVPDKARFLGLQSEISVEKFVLPRQDQTIFSYNWKYYALAKIKITPACKGRTIFQGCSETTKYKKSEGGSCLSNSGVMEGNGPNV